MMKRLVCIGINMKPRYKNKRDQYKAEAEHERYLKQSALIELEKLRKECEAKKKEEAKRYSARVYCSNCCEVHNVSIPPGTEIINGDCVNCRVRSSKLNQTLFLITNNL